MITRIVVENFQSIEHATLELGPWTSLVGESDVGKSAVLRALYAAITNQRGDYFVRHGAQACRVWIGFDDGDVSVEWYKRRGTSGLYTLRTSSAPADELHFEKTNGEVPGEIRALLRMQVQVADSEFMPGFQRQHDAPFLFADTARRRAQVLGEFDGTNLLLTADGIVRRLQRGEQAAASGLREQADAAEARLPAYGWVDGAEALCVAADAALAAALAREAPHQALVALAASMRGAQAVVVRAAAVAAAWDVSAATPHVAAMERHLLAGAAMRTLHGQVRTARAEVNRAEVLVDVAVPDIGPVLAAQQRLLALEFELRPWRDCIRDVVHARDVVLACEDDLAQVAGALGDLVGSTCPVCGTPLTVEALGL